jgi:hypothetical protein
MQKRMIQIYPCAKIRPIDVSDFLSYLSPNVKKSSPTLFSLVYLFWVPKKYSYFVLVRTSTHKVQVRTIANTIVFPVEVACGRHVQRANMHKKTHTQVGSQTTDRLAIYP